VWPTTSTLQRRPFGIIALATSADRRAPHRTDGGMVCAAVEPHATK
jgi:hypothetical protein